MLRSLAKISFILVLSVATTVNAQQGGTTRYVYDDNGRLIAVIVPTGEANLYQYDAAGNFIAILRLTMDDLALFAFTPRSGLPGDLVTFTGIGFGAGVSSVSFNGTVARIVSVSASIVIAEVPEGATTGPVAITTVRGTLTTSTPFVVQGVRVSPSSAKILPGDSVQFTARVSVGSADPSVIWSVNAGTITPTGLYTAPSQADPAVSVRATSVGVPSLFGEARVIVSNPEDIHPLIGAGVTVRRPTQTPGVIDHAAAISRGVTVQRQAGSSAPAARP